MKDIKQLILASSSPYRKALLQRLGIPFVSTSPDVDETPQAGETAQGLAERLALAKAQAVAEKSHNALIIASDQVASCNNALLGKPGDFITAAQQLRAQSGQQVIFHTSLTLLDTEEQSYCINTDTTSVNFRELSDAEIERYLQAEQPYDCAGSFKMEGLGISLFEAIDTEDPTALQGLPLITLCGMLRGKEYKLP